MKILENISEYDIRKKKALEYEAKIANPWPHNPQENILSIKTILGLFDKNNFVEDIHEKKEYYLQGRITHIREHGKSIFINISENDTTIQGYLNNNSPEYLKMKEYMDRGDIVLISGTLFYTKTQEKTVRIQTIKLLSKCLHTIPTEHNGLENIELRYRKRYLDILVNPHIKEVFVKRSKIIEFIRLFLNKEEYLEVETPMLHTIAGGALAKPFVTYHNALGMNLFLRIAPELFLKRLVVAGFHKVYEINKNFRNEGISVRHNPEFTMLEVYTAFKDYQWAMNFVEELIRGCCLQVNNTLVIEWNSYTINLEKPFARLNAKEAILKYTNLKEEYITKESINTLIPSEKQHLSYEEKIFYIFEEYAEKKLIEPTFLIDYPVSLSPLAKSDPHNPEVACRFELFLCGMELANGYNELNNPFDQEERFKDQIKKKEEGETETMPYDRDFIEALEYGMPPTAGIGIGIDRLCMLLTNSKSIKDVILFPTMKSIDE